MVHMITEVNTMAEFSAMPREGHLDNMFHVFTYLKIKYNIKIVFEPIYPEMGITDFEECNWKESSKTAK